MKELPIIFSGRLIPRILDGAKTMTRRVMNPQPADDGRPIRIWWRGGKSWDGDQFENVTPRWRIDDHLWVRETWATRGYMSDPLPIAGVHSEGLRLQIEYQADGEFSRTYYPDDDGYERIRALVRCYEDEKRWRPSIHMPRWASRITREVAGVRVERLQEITHEDAIAEGIERDTRGGWKSYEVYPDGTSHPHAAVPNRSPITSFSELWDSLNAKPKPVMVNGKVDHYVSYPWEDVRRTTTRRGKPWIIFGNPSVWVVEFTRLEP